MNFAALAYVAESNVEPIKYYRVNVGGMISLIEIMHAYGSGSIVFSSSCATYGIPSKIPVVETPSRIRSIPTVVPNVRQKKSCVMPARRMA